MIASRPLPSAACAALALALGAGCKPKIGDACQNALDCSTLGDRLCDVTQPGGYCTLFNCQPDSCPDDAACVVFRSELDPSCGNTGAGRYGRFAQTFCMRTCKGEKDCRDGYQCLRPDQRDARLLDRKRDNAAALQVCLALATLPAKPPVAPGVCSPGSAEPLKPYEGPMSTNASSTSSATSGGAGGQGGAAGSGAQGGASGAGGA